MERVYPDDYNYEKTDRHFASAKISTFGEPGYSEGPFVCDTPIPKSANYSVDGLSSAPTPGRPPRAIFGFRKKRVLILGAIVSALLLAVAIATALAVTFANKAKHENSATAAAPSSDFNQPEVQSSTHQSLSIETPTTSAIFFQSSASQTLTSTLTLSTSTSILTTTLGPGGVTIECPAANGTTYMSQNRIFIRLCATEHTPELGATDVKQTKAQTMEDCIDACTSFNSNFEDPDAKCIGVNWIYRKAQGQGNSYCWLKGSVKGSENWDGCEAALMVQ